MNRYVIKIIEKFTESFLWKKFRKNRRLFNIYKNVMGNKVERYILADRINDIQNNGMEIIIEITKCLEKSNVNFFVDNGTLLGIVREKNIISWDYDIDFGIFITQIFTWDDLEQQMKKIGFVKHHQFKYESMITEQTYKRGEMYVDFFNHLNTENNTSFYCFYKDENSNYLKKNQLSVMELRTEKITGTEKYILDGSLYVYIPNNAESYLAGIYGESWRVPNPNWVSGSGPACIKVKDKYGYLENEGK